MPGIVQSSYPNGNGGNIHYPFEDVIYQMKSRDKVYLGVSHEEGQKNLDTQIDDYKCEVLPSAGTTFENAEFFQGPPITVEYLFHNDSIFFELLAGYHLPDNYVNRKVNLTIN